MTKHAVVIAGAGPTGLMLAAELALARVDVAIVERRESQELAGSRAGGLRLGCVRHVAPVWHIRADPRVSYRLDQNAPVNVRADLCTASDRVIWQAERTA
jgi:ribulose 1,5-bisphosphate synthetase/thiazole synthase